MALPKIQGVYCIRCKSTGERYIGASIDVDNRWHYHQYKLVAGKHHNYRLQGAWQEKGAGDFDFTVLEEVSDLSALAARERFFQIQLKPEYNIRVTKKENPFQPSRRAKIAASLTGSKRKLSNEQREQARERFAFMRAEGMLDRPPLFGESNPASKLTVANVREIKLKLLKGGTRQIELARQYGVNRGAIDNIKAGKTWLHVTLEEGDQANG